jgi:hypothetical protein
MKTVQIFLIVTEDGFGADNIFVDECKNKAISIPKDLITLVTKQNTAVAANRSVIWCEGAVGFGITKQQISQVQVRHTWI